MSESPVTERQPPSQAVGVLDHRYRWLTVASTLAISIMAFEQLGLATVAPVIARELGGLSLYGWIFSAFLLAQIVGTVAAGQVVDRAGLRAPLLGSVALFGGGLLLAAVSPGMGLLLGGRAVQGVGAGALVTWVYATINRHYPDRLRSRMLATLSSAYVLPALIGPGVAGAIADRLSWRALFYGFLPLLALLAVLVAAARAGQPAAPAADSGHGRLPTALRLAAGTGLLLAGMRASGGQELRLGAAALRSPLLGLAIAAAGAVLAVPALRRLLPSGTLLARGSLQAAIATRGLLHAGYFSTEAYLALALSQLSRLPATAVGLAISTGAIAWAGGSWLQERLDSNDGGQGRRTRVLLGGTLLTLAVLTLSATAAVTGHTPLALVVGAWLSAGLGMGLALPAAAAIAFASAPHGREGTVSSSLLLADLLAPAAAIGAGAVLVNLGGTIADNPAHGIALALGLSPLAAALAIATAARTSATGPGAG